MHGSTPLVRRSVRRVLLAPLIGSMLAFAPSACGPATAEITVTAARIPVPANPSEAAVYLTITNEGDLGDRLIAASSDAASFVHLHETAIADDGLATMGAVSVLDVPAGETVELRPGRLHLMMMQPDEMTAGDEVPLTLSFEHAGDVVVTATVEAA